MTRVAVSGATGAMGNAVRDAIAAREDVTLALAVTRADERDVAEDVPVYPPEAFEAAIEEVGFDVFVDFSIPEIGAELVKLATEHGAPAVVGTTGFDSLQRDQLRRSAEHAPVLHSANFSRGVQALLAAVQGAVSHLPGYDVEVTETHHNRKRDAPSGTADRIVSTIEAERPDATRVHGRQGQAPRRGGEIGVHARRAGDITGEHEILLAGDAEELRLVHRAESRHVFAAGALDAAVWLADKPPGWYRFEDVLEP